MVLLARPGGGLFAEEDKLLSRGDELVRRRAVLD